MGNIKLIRCLILEMRIANNFVNCQLNRKRGVIMLDLVEFRDKISSFREQIQEIGVSL